MVNKKEVAVVQPQDNSAESLIAQAIGKGVDVGTMERLLAMRTQIKAENAKEAFNRALAQFQAECPTIVKTKQVFTKDGRSAYKYAPIESIVSQVKPFLQKNGFSYTTQIDLTEKGVKATCKVTHEQGHSDESSMEVPLGSKTQIMSDSQVTAAASTFAKRYAFCNAFGILTGDEDNDGAKFDTSPVKDDASVTITYDNPEDAPVKKKEKTELQKKKEIMELCAAITLHPLERTASAYENYFFAQTGLTLVPSNYDEGITILTKIKNGEETR